MADTIERTIYKIEIDDSDYIVGVNNLSDSTKKLSTAQEKANVTLEKLKSANIQLAEETKTLTSEYNKNAKQLREWAALQNQAVGPAAKDLAKGIKILTDHQNDLSKAIVVNKDLLKQSVAGIKDAEKASGGFASGLSKAYTGLSRIAQLIPGLGIGTLVGIISGPLVNAFQKWYDSIGRISDRQKIFNDITEGAIKNYASEVSKLDIIRGKLTDLNIPQEKRIALAKEYNKTAEESNKIDLKQIDNIALVNTAIDSQIEKIKQRALARAAETIIAEKAELFLLAQEEARLKNIQFSIDANKDVTGAKGNLMDQYVAAIKQKTFLAKQIEKDQKVIDAKKALDDALSVGAGFISIEGLFTDKGGKTKTAAALKEIQNEFDRKKAELDAKLAALTRKEEDNESKIRIEFAARLAKEQLEIEKLLKEKKVTKKQAGILSAENIEINDIELNKALETFRKKVTTAREKLNDEILRLQNKNTLDQLNLIQNEFNRRAQLIDFNEKKEIENAKDANQTRLQDFENNSLLIFGQDFKNNQEYLDKKAILIAAGEQVITNIILKAAQERKDLTADILKLALKKTEDAQKEAAGDKKKKGKDPRVETVQDYAVAIGQLTESIISFWLKANEAESNALDRSISLQEKRVEAAQRIATRGNAQYLKAEEDRLKEMTVKRENAARRELAINAALQASQLLVGITGAIAKIATPGIGIAETIGAIAVIFGALATGYGLVKSLQGNQPKLKEGTPYLNRNGQPAGTDTIPAWLNEGEAVIPTDKNKAYHPTVRAVYEGTVPAEHLNQFVNTYHKIKAVPQPNYQRIKEAAELKITHDGRMAVSLNEQNKLIQENTDVQRQVLKTLHKMGVNVSLDQRGFAVTQMEVIRQMEIDKRV